MSYPISHIQQLIFEQIHSAFNQNPILLEHYMVSVVFIKAA